MATLKLKGFYFDHFFCPFKPILMGQNSKQKSHYLEKIFLKYL